MPDQQFSYLECKNSSVADDLQFVIEVNNLNNFHSPYSDVVGNGFSGSMSAVLIVVSIIIFCLLLTIKPANLYRKKHVGYVVKTSFWYCVVALMITVVSATWTSPKLAQWYQNDHQHRKAIKTIREVRQPFNWLAEKTEVSLFVSIAKTMKAFDVNLSAAAIYYYTSKEKYFEAMTIASNTPDEYGFAEMVGIAYVNAAAHALHLNKPMKAVQYVRKALTRQRTNPIIKEALYRSLGQLSYVQAKNNQIERSLIALNEIPVRWAHAAHHSLISTVQRQHLIRSINVNLREETLDNSIRLAKTLHNRASWLKEKMPASIACDFASLLEIKGQAALEKEDSSEAIQAFLASEQLVKDVPFTQERLAMAYSLNGNLHLLAGRTRLAVESFQQLHTRINTADSACHLANALQTQIIDFAESENFAQGEASIKRVARLCNSEEARYVFAVFNYTKAMSSLRHGRWSDAEEAFTLAAQHPQLNADAGHYLAGMASEQRRYDMLVSSNYYQKLPNTTGQLCTEFIQHSGKMICASVAVFNNKKIVGVSSWPFKSVIFGDGDGYLALRDSSNDGNFDTFQRSLDNTDVLLVDNDQDDRPDWRFTYVKETLISEEALSGRISLRIPSGVVSLKNSDVFSAPDPYAVIKINNRYIGRTKTQNNNQFPMWASEEFVLHRRQGDTVSLHFMDEDLFFDDIIGVREFCQMPESGEYLTKNKNMTFYLDVQPSAKPEGRHLIDNPYGNVNVFFSENYIREGGDIARSIKIAHAEKARAEVRMIVASIAFPELAVFTFLRLSTLTTKFASIWLGYELVEKILTIE